MSDWSIATAASLAQLVADDELSCLALRSALALLRGEQIPADDQERIARYVTGEVGTDFLQSGRGDVAFITNAARAPRIVGELVVVLLKYGAFPPLSLLALHLELRRRRRRTVSETGRFFRLEKLCDDAAARRAFAREMASNGELCRDFWAAVAALRDDARRVRHDRVPPPADRPREEIARPWQ